MCYAVKTLAFMRFQRWLVGLTQHTCGKWMQKNENRNLIENLAICLVSGACAILLSAVESNVGPTFGVLTLCCRSYTLVGSLGLVKRHSGADTNQNARIVLAIYGHEIKSEGDGKVCSDELCETRLDSCRYKTLRRTIRQFTMISNDCPLSGKWWSLASLTRLSYCRICLAKQQKI